MEVSIPNELGCLAAGPTERVAKLGHSHAEVNISMGLDRRYYHGVSLAYTYGGFGGPICVDGDGFANAATARPPGWRSCSASGPGRSTPIRRASTTNSG